MNASSPDSPHLDVIFMPGVAFDRAFARLGHGKGYYDRFINAYTSERAHRPLLVALALREQIVPTGQIPMSEHDIPVDVIVSPDEVIIRADLDERTQRVVNGEP